MSLAPRLRQMVGAGVAEYSIDATAYWTDAQLDEVLGRHRLLFARVPVALLPETVAGERVIRLGNFDVAGVIDPADAPDFIASDGETIYPATVAGDVATFNPVLGGNTSGVTMTGFAFDLHAAAAEVLEAWAGAVQLDFDVSTDGQSMKRSQKAEQLRAGADRHRRQSLVGSVALS